MVNTKMIRAQMVLNNYTIEKLAKEIGVSTKTLSSRLNHCPEKFTQEEMKRIVTILNIENPTDIFFGAK